MAVRVRHHVNPYRMALLSLRPPTLALPQAPVDVELGCADAQFLFQLAALHPQQTFVGVEIRKAHVEDVNRRARDSQLPHLHAVHAHINVNLGDLFAERQVRRFYINFPDPWFKRTQHKRRLITPALSSLLCSRLTSDGEIFFQSDIYDLALDAMAVFETTAGLVNVRGEWSFLPKSPYPVTSLREDRVTAKGQPVWRMLYVRSPNSRPICDGAIP